MDSHKTTPRSLNIKFNPIMMTVIRYLVKSEKIFLDINPDFNFLQEYIEFLRRVMAFVKIHVPAKRENGLYRCLFSFFALTSSFHYKKNFFVF